MNYQAIIDKYYPEDNELKHILMVHSRKVADKALAIVDQHPELNADRQFVEEASMLYCSYCFYYAFVSFTSVSYYDFNWLIFQ